jgi:plastocyanin
MTITSDLPFTARLGALRRRWSTLDVIIIAGLLGIVAAFTLAQLLERTIIPPVLIESIVYLVCAGIAATGWRWAAVVPLIAIPIFVLSNLLSGFPTYTLTHPSDFLPVAVEAIEFMLSVMILGACSVKLAQTLRHETPHAPQWMKPTLAALAGLAIGALLVGGTAQPGTAGSVSTGGSGTATVRLTFNRFAPDIVALHKGETLTFVDEGSVPHMLANSMWIADKRPSPGVETGAPAIRTVGVNDKSVTIDPFTTLGTYHIYCTVHPGMTLTVLVE